MAMGKAGKGEFDAEVGQLIKAERCRQGVSQQELARRTGVHRNVIHRYEIGASGCTIWSLEKVAAALGVPVATLIPRDRT